MPAHSEESITNISNTYYFPDEMGSCLVGKVRAYTPVSFRAMSYPHDVSLAKCTMPPYKTIMKPKIYYKLTMREYNKLAVDKECYVCFEFERCKISVYASLRLRLCLCLILQLSLSASRCIM